MGRPPNPDQSTTYIVADIAAQLSETNPPAQAQIKAIIEAVGEDQARAWLTETLDIEAKGGMQTKNQKRRRTPGGVYLYLARGRLPKETQRQIFPYPHKRKGKGKQSKPKPFRWEERLDIFTEIEPTSGEVQTVKLTLIGRPGKLIDKGQVMLTTMKSTKAPSLPKGLPKPPDKETTYIVFIAAKQWRRVAESIKDPEDALIVEGYPFFDERLKTIAVLGQSVTTKLLQRAKREAG